VPAAWRRPAWEAEDQVTIAALYDIHGNLPALEAVLGEVVAAGVDEVVVGGDVVSGPMPREVLELLLGLDVPVRFIKGNADREVVARMRGEESGDVPAEFLGVVQWVAEQLQPDYEPVLAGWPAMLQEAVDGVGEVLFCHATPRNDTEIFLKTTAEAKLLPVFAGVSAGLVVCGHTHMQFDRTVGAVRVVNAGSVGMPYGEPGAYWLLLGKRGVELRRTVYDFAKAADRIRATGYPMAEDFAENNVVRPPGEAEVLEVFGRGELK
jgi:predicted phosphodiesterase